MIELLELLVPLDQPFAVALNLAIAIVAAWGIKQVIQALVADVGPTLKDLEHLEGLGRQDNSDALLQEAEELRPGGFVRQRLDVLGRLKANQDPVDPEMLAAISADAFRTAAPVARWATSFLVLLGLTGTLVGLSFAVSELSTLLGNGMGTGDMVNAILDTLGRMRLAFSTTLAGVGGSILVGSFLAVLRHKQSRAIRKLEELSSTQWVPLFRTSDEARLGNAVRELEKTRKILKEGLDQTLEDVRCGFQELHDRFAERSDELLRQVGRLRDATLEIIGERSDSSLSLAQYVDTVKATTAELQEGVRASGELLPQIRDALQETIRLEHESLQQALTEHTRAVQPVLQRQESAAKALAEVVSSERALLADLQDVLLRLNSSLQTASGAWEEADQTIEKMGRTTAQALRDGLHATLDAVTHQTEEQSKSQRRITMSLDDLQTTQKKTIQSLAAQSQKALNRSEEMVAEIRETLRESVDRVGERLTESERALVSRVEMGLNNLARELRDLTSVDGSRRRPESNWTQPLDAVRGDPVEPDEIQRIRDDLPEPEE
ncbi:hypothetical protein [Candidatus Palauibacter sp.]|uniref:hypothetical protein n=1 Tax=Candidatus Palauibacter sp. TaxID=3101350 RepID=UPI003B02D155